MDMIPRGGTYGSIAVGRALKKMDGQVRNGLRFEIVRGQYSPTRFRITKPGVVAVAAQAKVEPSKEDLPF
jgi:hypothetical protein